MIKQPKAPLPIPNLDEFFKRHFFASLSKADDIDGCWLWRHAKSGQGYGRLKIGDKLYSPHRVSYTLTNGAIPAMIGREKAVIMHICDNPACCRPSHLKLGTYRDNARDMVAKKRHVQATPPNKVILPPETLAMICQSPLSGRALAQEMGLSQRCVHRVRREAGIDQSVFKNPRPAA